MVDFSISEKKVVITGALGLLGRQFVQTFKNGGAVPIMIDLQKNDDSYDNYYSCDITDPGAIKATRDAIQQKHGVIDVLINNAAFNPKVEEKEKHATTFENYPLEKWQKEIEINLTGTMLMCQAMRPLMQGGSIINIASIYALVGPDQRIYPDDFEKPASYGASKAGVIALTKHLATLWGKDNVRVNAVVYGGFENGQDAEFIRRYAQHTPLGRMARPDEATGVVQYLASDASSYATGSIFTVDGGWTAW